MISLIDFFILSLSEIPLHSLGNLDLVLDSIYGANTYGFGSFLMKLIFISITISSPSPTLMSSISWSGSRILAWIAKGSWSYLLCWSILATIDSAFSIISFPSNFQSLDSSTSCSAVKLQFCSSANLLQSITCNSLTVAFLETNI